MPPYKLTNDGSVLCIGESNTISFDPAGSGDAAETYRMWLGAGNTPDPADPITPAARTLPKKIIFERAVTANLFDRLYAVLHSNAVLYETWSAYQNIEVDPLDDRVAQVFAGAELTADEIAALIAPQ